MRAVKAGLAKYFADYRCVLVNSDGGSSDGTPDVVLKSQIQNYQTILVQHPVQPIHKITTPYHGIPGKGSAFRTIFHVADELQVKASNAYSKLTLPETPMLFLEFHGTAALVEELSRSAAGVESPGAASSKRFFPSSGSTRWASPAGTSSGWPISTRKYWNRW